MTQSSDCHESRNVIGTHSSVLLNLLQLPIKQRERHLGPEMMDGKRLWKNTQLSLRKVLRNVKIQNGGRAKSVFIFQFYSDN